MDAGPGMERSSWMPAEGTCMAPRADMYVGCVLLVAVQGQPFWSVLRSLRGVVDTSHRVTVGQGLDGSGCQVGIGLRWANEENTWMGTG